MLTRVKYLTSDTDETNSRKAGMRRISFTFRHLLPWQYRHLWAQVRSEVLGFCPRIHIEASCHHADAPLLLHSSRSVLIALESFKVIS